jgi:hypothetical protein
MLAVLALIGPASAWEHTGYYWETDSFPLKWWHDTEPAEDSLPEGYGLQAIQMSWDGWEAGAPCAKIADEYQGEVSMDGRNGTDGRITFHWEDPGDEAATGVLGTTYYAQLIGSGRKTANGRTYREMLDADIVFNNNVDFGTVEDIDAGSGEISIVGVSTHEVGHLYGLAHSCEDGEACDDELLRNATMFWQALRGNESNSINEDDIESISRLYGSFGSFFAGDNLSAVFGPLPLTVSYTITSDAEVIGASWQFGDGGTSEEFPTATHTYETTGQYSVRCDMTLADPVCGQVEFTQREIAYVTACGPPAPAGGADGFFQVERTEGLQYRTVNHTDVSTYGCIDLVEWQIFKGSGAGAIAEENLVNTIGAWSPTIEFPDAGNYVVVMNVGGAGGISSSYVDVEASADTSSACASVNLAVAGAGTMMAGLLALRRRR